MDASHEPTPDGHATDDMTDEEKRRDQLLAAPAAVPEDAAPRIDVSHPEEGVTRIDIRDDAPVRPGNPEEPPRPN